MTQARRLNLDVEHRSPNRRRWSRPPSPAKALGWPGGAAGPGYLDWWVRFDNYTCHSANHHRPATADAVDHHDHYIAGGAVYDQSADIDEATVTVDDVVRAVLPSGQLSRRRPPEREVNRGGRRRRGQCAAGRSEQLREDGRPVERRPGRLGLVGFVHFVGHGDSQLQLALRHTRFARQ